MVCFQRWTDRHTHWHEESSSCITYLIEGCLRRARDCLFWPGISSELKQYISTCETCRIFETTPAKEALMSHDEPDWSWQKVEIGLLTHKSFEYVITMDYFSNFWEMPWLKKLKHTFQDTAYQLRLWRTMGLSSQQRSSVNSHRSMTLNMSEQHTCSNANAYPAEHHICSNAETDSCITKINQGNSTSKIKPMNNIQVFIHITTDLIILIYMYHTLFGNFKNNGKRRML